MRNKALKRAWMRTYKRDLYDTCKRLGLCPHCKGGVEVVGDSRCRACKDKNNAQKRARAERNNMKKQTDGRRKQRFITACRMAVLMGWRAVKRGYYGTRYIKRGRGPGALNLSPVADTSVFKNPRAYVNR